MIAVHFLRSPSWGNAVVVFEGCEQERCSDFPAEAAPIGPLGVGHGFARSPFSPVRHPPASPLLQRVSARLPYPSLQACQAACAQLQEHLKATAEKHVQVQRDYEDSLQRSRVLTADLAQAKQLLQVQKQQLEVEEKLSSRIQELQRALKDLVRLLPRLRVVSRGDWAEWTGVGGKGGRRMA